MGCRMTYGELLPTVLRLTTKRITLDWNSEVVINMPALLI